MNDYLLNLEQNEIISFKAFGESMWPTLISGKSTVILKKKNQRLKKYDIGFYIRENKEFVLHRVVEVLKDGYMFMGDSQDFTEKVLEENVVAVLIGYYKGKKFIDAKADKQIKKAEKLYKNDKKRLREAKIHNFIVRLKGKIKGKKEGR